MSDSARWEARFHRERAARREAERVGELRARELFSLNERLEGVITGLAGFDARANPLSARAAELGLAGMQPDSRTASSSGTLDGEVVVPSTEVSTPPTLASIELPPVREPQPESWKSVLRRLATMPTRQELVIAVSATLGATLVGRLLQFESSESDTAMIFLAAVAIAAARIRLVAGLLASLCASLGYMFAFVQPEYSLKFTDTRYWFTVVVMCAVGSVIAFMSSRLQDRAGEAAAQELLNAELLAFSQDLASVENVEQATKVAALHWPIMIAPSFAGRRRVKIELEQVLDGEIPWDELAKIAPHRRTLIETAIAMLREVLVRIVSVEVAEAARARADDERIRSTLLSSVSHDLRTPLAGITGAASTLMDDGASLDDETRFELRRRILSEADRLQRLVGNVLQLTRLDDQRLQLALDWELPDEVVASTVKAVNQRLGIHAALVSSPEPALVRMDAVLMEQVVTNLLENAALYAGKDAAIELRVSHEAEHYIIEVADRGPGFGDMNPAQLFRKFVRGTTGTGSGLGLSICHAAARLHGGTITAAERDGGGAVFCLRLPMGGPNHEIPPVFDDILESEEVET